MMGLYVLQCTITSFEWIDVKIYTRLGLYHKVPPVLVACSKFFNINQFTIH